MLIKLIVSVKICTLCGLANSNHLTRYK